MADSGGDDSEDYNRRQPKCHGGAAGVSRAKPAGRWWMLRARSVFPASQRQTGCKAAPAEEQGEASSADAGEGRHGAPRWAQPGAGRRHRAARRRLLLLTAAAAAMSTGPSAVFPGQP